MTVSTIESTQSPKKARRPAVPMNGVDVPTLFATLDAVRGQPGLAKFVFRAKNQWIKGTHSRTTLGTFSGAGGDHEHTCNTTFDGDHPAVLCGKDNGPTPVEYLLHALATCIMAGIGNIAAARGIRLESVEATVEGDIDLQGILGLSDEVRNGYQGIRISFRIQGDASEEQLEQLVQQSKARSAVFDVLTNGVPVDFDVEVA